MCSEEPYTPEEQTLADQIARNAGLVAECPRHPDSSYKAFNRLDTVNRLDAYLMKKQDSLIGLIHRTDIQRKALILLALRLYEERCPLCQDP